MAKQRAGTIVRASTNVDELKGNAVSTWNEFLSVLCESNWIEKNEIAKGQRDSFTINNRNLIVLDWDLEPFYRGSSPKISRFV